MSFDLVYYNMNNVIINNNESNNITHFIITTKNNKKIHLKVTNDLNKNITLNFKEEEFFQIILIMMFLMQLYILLNSFSKYNIYNAK